MTVKEREREKERKRQREKERERELKESGVIFIYFTKNGLKQFYHFFLFSIKKQKRFPPTRLFELNFMKALEGFAPIFITKFDSFLTGVI